MNKDKILARWFINEISDEEFKKYFSDEEFLSYLKLKKGISLYETSQTPISDDVYKNIKQKITKNSINKSISIYKKIVAVAAVLFIFFAVDKYFDKQSFVVETAKAEQQKITLPNGSEIILAANSKIKYSTDNWENNREIFLEGTAYFNIEKGADFIVNTSNAKVVALGTNFSVSSMDDFFKATCFLGKIKVNINKESSILSSGQTIQKIADNIAVYNNESSQNNWSIKITKLRAVPLKYVIKTIENQFDIKINSNKIDDNILFTGSINNNDLDLTLKIVFKALNINVNKHNQIIELTPIH